MVKATGPCLLLARPTSKPLDRSRHDGEELHVRIVALRSSRAPTRIRTASPAGRRDRWRCACRRRRRHRARSCPAGPTTQRAAVYGSESTSASTLYSSFSRAASTSSCSGPTVPRIGSRRPTVGNSTCIRPFFFELPNRLVELLEAHVAQARDAEVLRREIAGSADTSAACRHRACRRCRTARDSPGRRRRRETPARSSRACRRRTGTAAPRESPAPCARVGDHHVLLEHARADAQERDAIAMPAVHVRLDLEDEPAEVRRLGRNHAVIARRGPSAAAPARSSAFRNGSRPKFDSALPKNTGVCRKSRYAW